MSKRHVVRFLIGVAVATTALVSQIHSPAPAFAAAGISAAKCESGGGVVGGDGGGGAVCVGGIFDGYKIK